MKYRILMLILSILVYSCILPYFPEGKLVITPKKLFYTETPKQDEFTYSLFFYDEQRNFKIDTFSIVEETDSSYLVQVSYTPVNKTWYAEKRVLKTNINNPYYTIILNLKLDENDDMGQEDLGNELVKYDRMQFIVLENFARKSDFEDNFTFVQQTLTNKIQELSLEGMDNGHEWIYEEDITSIVCQQFSSIRYFYGETMSSLRDLTDWLFHNKEKLSIANFRRGDWFYIENDNIIVDYEWITQKPLIFTIIFTAS